MAGILKNQILKYLSKFAKNVSSNSIHLSTLRGEGELKDLELNEKVLGDLLELPNWLKISKASVNRVSLKIQWTKLKSTPILMALDEVYVTMETCSDFSSNSAPTDFSAYNMFGKYGFANKVIDGMTVTINSVLTNFKSAAFTMSFQLSYITLCSKSPLWQNTDLRMTRLKDPNQQFILIFKEISWQTLKIEIRSSDIKLTPVRLITNQSCCRLTVKKKLCDCSVVGCRLVLLADEILWVLTDVQLLSAYQFMDSLTGLIKKATEESQKNKAARKLESISCYMPSHAGNIDGSGIPSHPTGLDKESRSSSGGFWQGSYSTQHQSEQNVHKYQIFKKFDVIETSYHFYTSKIDLHFCDDPGVGRSNYPDLEKGGTIQVCLLKLKMDYYPYHLAMGDRIHWVKYNEAHPYQWLKRSLNEFRATLIEIVSKNKSSHIPLGKASPHVGPKVGDIAAEYDTLDDSPPAQVMSSTKSVINSHLQRLMSTCLIINLADINVYKVSTAKMKKQPEKLMSGDHSRLCLPADTSIVQVELTYFYNPGGFNFPVPSPKMYFSISPLKLDFDHPSILWLNAFFCGLRKRICSIEAQSPYIDIYIEALMPRIVIKPTFIYGYEEPRPRSMQIQTSRFILTNVRSADPTAMGSCSSLFTCLEEAQNGPLFFGSGFPSLEKDMKAIPQKFIQHAMGADCIRPSLLKSKSTILFENLTTHSLSTEARDVFFMGCDPVWIDFRMGIEKKRHVSFVDPFPLSIWMHFKGGGGGIDGEGGGQVKNNMNNLNLEQKISRRLNINEVNYNDIQVNSDITQSTCRDAIGSVFVYALAYVPTMVKAQINHLQFLFLMRTLDVMTEFSTFLSHDAEKILGSKDEDSIVAAGVIPCVSVYMIFDPLLEDVTQSECPSMCSEINDIPQDKANSILSSPCDNFNEKNFDADFSNSQLNICSSEIQNIPCAIPQEAISMENRFDQAPTHAISCDISESSSLGAYSPVNLDNSCASISSPNAYSFKNDNYLCAPNQTQLKGVTNVGLNQDIKVPSISSMTRGFTTGINSIMSSIENSVKTPDDISDTVSIRSDLSNDSSHFVMLHLDNELDVAGAECSFKAHSKVETASEVQEDLTSVYKSETENSLKNKKMIGFANFRIGRIQFIYEGHGYDSLIKVQSSTLASSECPSISNSDFENIFSSQHRDLNGHFLKSNQCVCKIRFRTAANCSSELNSLERFSFPLPVQRDRLAEVEICGGDLSLFNSSLSNLSTLIEDELLPLPMVVKVQLEDFVLNLTDNLSKQRIVNSSSLFSRDILIPKMSLVMDELFNIKIIPLEKSDSGNDENLPTIAPSEYVEKLERELINSKDKLTKLEEENLNLKQALDILTFQSQ